jgi:hypothetical protein
MADPDSNELTIQSTSPWPVGIDYDEQPIARVQVVADHVGGLAR